MKARLHDFFTKFIHHKHTNEVVLSEPFVAYAEKAGTLAGLL